jgi:arylsulfatase A-like enzyme
MAAEGLPFANGYANSSVCSPPRFATGCHQHRIHGGFDEPIGSVSPALGLPPDHPTMASLLRGAADATAQMGFFPWLSPLKNDYDEFFGHHTGAVDFTNRSRQVRSVGWGRGGIRRRVSDSISRAAPPSACCPK